MALYQKSESLRRNPAKLRRYMENAQQDREKIERRLRALYPWMGQWRLSGRVDSAATSEPTET